MGPEVFGWFSYAGAVVSFGAAFANLGLDSIVVRESVSRPASVARIMAAAFVWRLVIGALAAAMIAAALPWISGPGALQRGLLAIALFGAFGPAFAVPMLWFQARTQARVAVRAGLWGFGLVTALRLWLLWRGASPFAFAWASAIETVGAPLLVFGAMTRRGGRLEFQQLWCEGKALLHEAWPLLVGALAATLYMRVDQIMLRWLSGADAVGLYAAATRFSDAAYAIPFLAGASAMATLTASAQDPVRFPALLSRYVRASAALGYALVIPLIAAAPLLVPLAYGRDFSDASTIAQIHLLSVVFVSISVARGRVLVIRGLTRFAMWTAVIGGGVNVVLNAALIPRWGAAGAAVATVVAHATAALLTTLVYRPTRELGWCQVRALLRPGLRISI